MTKQPILSKVRRLCLYAVIPVFFASSGVEAQTVGGDILKLLEISGSAEMVTQMVDAFILQFKEMYPMVPQALWDGLKAKASSKDILLMGVPIYEKYYTHDEIKQLIAFYESPVGRKMVQVMPAMTEEMMTIGQKWGEKLIAELIGGGQ